MAAGTGTGVTHIADELTHNDRITGLYHHTVQVHILRLIVVQMVDGNIVAATAAIPACIHYNAGTGSIDRHLFVPSRTLGRCQVHAGVAGPLAGSGVIAVAKGRADAVIVARQRPCKTVFVVSRSVSGGVVVLLLLFLLTKPFLILPLLGCRKLHFHIFQRFLHLFHSFLGLFYQVLEFLTLSQQLQQNSACFFLLLRQSHLLLFHFIPGEIQSNLLLRQNGLGIFYLAGGLFQSLQTGGIRLGNFLDHIKTVQ